MGNIYIWRETFQVHGEYKEKIRKDSELKKNDFRCEQPMQLSKATEKELNDVFSVMTKCWNINPAERPKFCTLEEDLHHFHAPGDLIVYNTILIQ